VHRGRIRGRTLLIALLAVFMTMAVAGIAAAAPAPKVDVCHYDADTGLFHLINISGNAFDAHMAHGDAVPGGLFPGAVTLPLTSGWDGTHGGSGDVVYGDVAGDDCAVDALRVTFTLDGAYATHTYTVGAHLVGLTGLAFANGNTTGGTFGTAGWWVADSGPIMRDGILAGPLSAADFGFLTTNGSGDGSATFDLEPGSGAYSIQFTVREGTNCFSPSFSGCNVVFRTGEPFLQNTADITIP